VRIRVKVFRIRFIFDFIMVFTLNFLKMVLSCGHFGPGVLQGAGFLGEHFFCGFSGAPAEMRATLEQPRKTSAAPPEF
jgi:hypothetical protein